MPQYSAVMDWEVDQGLVSCIDGECRRRKMTRTSYIAWATRRGPQMGGQA